MTVFDDDTAVHEDHAVGHAARKVHFMCHDEHRHALFGQFTHHAQHVTNELGVEGTRGLVEQHDLGLHRECTRDRHTLLLTTGELGGVRRRFFGQADTSQQLFRLGFGGRPVLFEHLSQGDRDVVENRHVSEQIERLEDHARRGARTVEVAVGVGEFDTVDENLAVGGRFEHVDAPQKRALARSRRPDDADNLALRDGEIDAAQNVVRAESFVQSLDAHQLFAHRLPAFDLRSIHAASWVSGIVRAR